MATNRKIQTALVSVYHKDGLEPLLRALHRQGVQFLSTGGTHDFICSLGLPCERVEDLTGYPSILGGRVKTLHPKVFGASSDAAICPTMCSKWHNTKSETSIWSS